MVIVLCLPQATPITITNLNYSPVALGAVLLYALCSWFLSAKHWYKISPIVAITTTDDSRLSTRPSSTRPSMVEMRPSLNLTKDYSAKAPDEIVSVENPLRPMVTLDSIAESDAHNEGA